MLARTFGPVLVTHAGVASYFQAPGELVWHDDLGLVGTLYDPELGTQQRDCIVQLDGVAHARRIGGIEGYLSHNLLTGGLTMVDTFDWYEAVDMRTLRPRSPVTFTQASLIPWTVLPDGRRVYATGGVIYVRSSAGTAVEEYDLRADGVTHTGLAMLSPGRTNTVFVSFADGTIYEYDWRSIAKVGRPRFVPAALTGAFYSPALGVFIQVNGDAGGPHYVSVFADEVQPASISNPAVVGTAKRGAIVTLRARVLGDEDDPCEGWPVNWTLTGDDVTLLQEQSLTDEDGYAEVEVRVDPTATVSATFDLDADLAC